MPSRHRIRSKSQSAGTLAIFCSAVAWFLSPFSALATHGDLATFTAMLDPIQNYGILALDNTTLEIKSTISNGNVGVADGGSLSLKSSGFVDGDIFMDSGATLVEYNPLSHNGTLFTGQDLSAAAAGAINLASYAAGLDPDTILGSINTDLTLNGSPGLNVYSIASIQLTGTETLTLDGPADAIFILNVSGIFELKAASARVVAGGGAGPGNIFINIVGAGSTVTTEVGTLIEGIFLSPERGVKLYNVNGKVIASSTITFQSGTVLNNVAAVPEPSTAILFLSGWVLLMRLRSRSCFGLFLEK